MDEKKTIKVNLSTVILLFVIFVLLVCLGVLYYFGFVLDKSKTNNATNNTLSNTATTTTTTPSVESVKEDDGLLTNDEITSILGKEGARFVIDNIEKDGDDYIITAYMLEDNIRKLTQEEYDKISSGEDQLSFRNHLYRRNSLENYSDDYFTIESGEKSLTIKFNKEADGTYYIYNGMQKVTKGLRDTVEKPIRFRISNTTEICSNYDDDKYSIFELNKEISYRSGEYEEFYADVENGKVKTLYIHNN